MTAYITRRILFMIPTLVGIMLATFVVVQFAPGGPVEQVIAKISGADTGAASRCHQLEIPRRARSRSRIHQEPGEAVRVRQAGL